VDCPLSKIAAHCYGRDRGVVYFGAAQQLGASMRVQVLKTTRNICSTATGDGRVAFLAAWSVCAVAGGLALTIAASRPALADPNQPRVAWGFVNMGELSGSCVNFCFINPKKGEGGGVNIDYLGTGSYEVELGIIPPGPDDFQVGSDVSNGFINCMTAGWSGVTPHHKGGVVDVLVNCYDASGNPEDSSFSFLYQSRGESFGSAGKGIAFLLANEPTEASYTPDPDYQFNSTGATNAMVRNGTGSYTATIPGLTKKGGNVQVTADGSSFARCKVSDWSSDQSGTSVNVLCFDVTGAAADEMFTLAYTIGEPMGLWQTEHAHGDIGTYVWADKPDKTKVYAPPRAYNYNGFGTGSLTVQRTAAGVYDVTFPDEQPYTPASALVTANGSVNTSCIVNNGGDGYDPTEVLCFDQSGNSTDSAFSVLVQTDENE
jgi:hypothetical protein